MTDIELCHGLYVAHRPVLVRYAARLLGSRDAAEDIVQDAYLRFVPAVGKAETARQPSAYLYRIVRNLAFDMLKRRKLETRETQDEPPYWTVPSPARTPEQALLLSDEMLHVSRALSELDRDVRIALEMHRFGGHTLEEVASHLGISVATAHRHVRSAMLHVARAMAGADRE